MADVRQMPVLDGPFADHYDRAAGARPLQHWQLPNVGHTAAIREAPAYERRVTAFFDAALLGG